MMTTTKTRILDAAEALFAERGYSATSLRDITALADVNLLSVNYHFGSKDALLEAVFKRCVVPVNDERIRLLDLVEAKDGLGPLDSGRVVRAFLVPAFQMAGESGPRAPKFMQLVGRMYSETSDQYRGTFLKLYLQMGARFTSALAQSLPHLEADEVMRRLHFLVGSLAHTMIWQECCHDVMGLPVKDHGEVMEALARFAVGGMTASGDPSKATAPKRVTKSSHRRHRSATRRPSETGMRMRR